MDVTGGSIETEWTQVTIDTKVTCHTPPSSWRVFQSCVNSLSALSGSLAYSAGKVYEIAAKALVVPAETSLVQDLENFSFDYQDTEQYKNQLTKLKVHVSTTLGDVSKLYFFNQFVLFLGQSLAEAEKNLSESKYAQLSKQRQEITRSLFVYLESLKEANIEKRIDCARLIRRVIEPF